MKCLITCGVPILQGKKDVVVGSKISQSESEALQVVCDREDRSMSYVLRELAIRGLAQYYRDGSIKTMPADDEVIRNGLDSDASVGRTVGVRIAKAKNLGEMSDKPAIKKRRAG